ncbi:hypothetical protein GUJ93_ZPchr0001g31431 [Zizania palustris]|uniref:Uncharacterized protein n=1 Tax=Zizania palustris TaxID=103762 RepID=A0A8J5V973_ZIZPA|nr:hypothetical protein GUJ93_ZPchr0001g31431 [Zizania palustris]
MWASRVVGEVMGYVYTGRFRPGCMRVGISPRQRGGCTAGEGHYCRQRAWAGRDDLGQPGRLLAAVSAASLAYATSPCQHISHAQATI